jgi:TadE-like protein
MTPAGRAFGRDEGQASVELVAVVPVLLIVTLAVAQLAVAGYALWSAGAAARAGARAGYVGGDAEAAARRSLPAPLRHGAQVKDSDSVEVRVRAPALIPGIPSVPVTARAGLGAGDGS